MMYERGMKYELIIKELMKNIPSEFEDRDTQGETLVSMEATNTLINLCMPEV